jgi:hypothetical protein
MPIAALTLYLHPAGDTGPQDVVNGKAKDHGDILKHHRGLAAQMVEHVGLRTPPVDKCHQHGGVHHRQTANDETSKRQEPRTPY